jgi:hypothetical protein
MFLALIASLSAAASAPPPSCDAAAVEQSLHDLLARERFADAHQVALAAAVFCARDDRPRWLLADAVALASLEDLPRALELASDVAHSAPEPYAGRAAVLRAWIAVRARDPGAAAPAIAAVPPPDARRRLCLLARADDLAPAAAGCPAVGGAPEPPALLAAEARYRAARVTRRPWLAAVLSAIVPGAGQLYAGSAQGASVALVLNAATIGGTVELARHHLYWASALTGLAAATVYVGNIVNAADLARRRDDVAADAARAPLERMLVPERFAPAASP